METFDLTRRRALIAGLGVTAAGCASTGAAGEASFGQGVAAGDPRPDAVVIWTRATPARRAARAVPLTWVVADDPALQSVLARGEVEALAANDYCAKVDVRGLAPGRAYHYAFFAGETASPVGRATTLPVGRVDQIKLAVFSCSNYPFGRFHAYADMAARAAAEDITAALHLGDYLYEGGGPGGWGYEQGEANGRAHDPAHEIVTLDDYRRRYRQYRSDPDLQAAHAATSWILTWDDHEFTNNPWMRGAQNHNEGEGAWEDRKAAGLRAYFEWMPIRDPDPGRAREAIWRSFEFGDLATLVMLETRLTGRDEQLDYGRDLGWIETAYTPDANGVMRPLSAEELRSAPPSGVERLRTPFDVSGPEPRPILDYDSAKLIDPANLPENIVFMRDVEAFRDRLYDPDRRMIDPAQEEFVLETVRDSHARGVAWQVLGNQIIFAHQPLFDFSAHYDDRLLDAMAEADPYVAGRIELGRYGLPGNMDAWDGYPAQRDRISAAFSEEGAHPVILTGDTHLFWANEVRDPAGARCAAEFGTTGVTSPGSLSAYDGLDPPFAEVLAAGYEQTRQVSDAARGYLIVTFTPDAAVCEMIGTSAPTEPVTRSFTVARWTQRRRGPDGELPALEEGGPDLRLRSDARRARSA